MLRSFLLTSGVEPSTAGEVLLDHSLICSPRYRIFSRHITDRQTQTDTDVKTQHCQLVRYCRTTHFYSLGYQIFSRHPTDRQRPTQKDSDEVTQHHHLLERYYYYLCSPRYQVFSRHPTDRQRRADSWGGIARPPNCASQHPVKKLSERRFSQTANIKDSYIWYKALSHFIFFAPTILQFLRHSLFCAALYLR